MIDEIIKAGKVEELKVLDCFEGFAGAPGVAEGPVRATRSIGDGDIIRVNGDRGVVEVFKRART
jgi:hypothetical protein